MEVPEVFLDPPALMDNVRRVLKHLEAKLRLGAFSLAQWAQIAAAGVAAAVFGGYLSPLPTQATIFVSIVGAGFPGSYTNPSGDSSPERTRPPSRHPSTARWLELTVCMYRLQVAEGARGCCHAGFAAW